MSVLADSLVFTDEKPVMGPPESASKRRKLEPSHPYGDPFYITPNPKSAAFSNAPILVTPKAVLSRLLIPLHWTVSSAPPRTFSAKLPCLDTPGKVLIVKYENERQLAAVEKVDKEKYVLLRMSSSVKLTDMKKLLAFSKKISSEESEGVPFGTMSTQLQEEWWGAIKAEEATPAQSTSDRFDLLPNKIQMKLPEVMKSAKSPKPKSAETESAQKTSEVIKKEPTEKKDEDAKFRVTASKPANSQEQELSPEEILKQIGSQYFEALYIAKSPLAYFAKSTLAKARNAFRLDNPAPHSRLDLLRYLKTLRVPLKRLDKKYQKAIGQVANEVTVDEPTLFSEGEREYVDRWVARVMSDEKTRGKSATQNEQRLKRKISDLRLRESELQIILVLEIMAISSKFPEAVIENLDAVAEADDSKPEGKKAKKSKKSRKSRSKDEMTFIPEPAVHLDLLVDRLCIWQLVGSALVIDDAPNSSQQQQTKDSRDHIQHFAIEVVMTFFSSRLPDACQAIKRRCSGKAPTSNYAERKAAADAKQKEAQERKSVKDRESAPPHRPPSLARSVTAPASLLARTEREGSFAGSLFGAGDTQCSASAKPADSLSVISRGGVMASKNIDKRQVQISRKKPAAKADDSQRLQQDLKSAIQGIAKPNRVAAAKEFAADSVTRQRGNGKKPQRPQHKPKTNVQVAATPRANRRIQNFHMPKPMIQSPIVEEDHVPSSDVVIPQSTVKKNKTKEFGADIFDEEFSTPTRVPPPARHRTALLPSQSHFMSDNIGSSPMLLPRSLSDSFAKLSKPKKDLVEDTPQKPKDRENIYNGPSISIHETPTKPAVLSTPSKRRYSDYHEGEEGGVSLGSPLPRAPMRNFALSTPLANKRAKPTPLANSSAAETPSGKDGGVSIYEQLGWDDDY